MSSLRWSPALALIVCTWSARAHAGQPNAAELEARAQAHREAGEADREGREGGDPDGFAKCATAYLDALALGSDRDDELLWNAGACAYEAAQVGQAMQCWRALADRHPNSDLAGPALLRLADTAGSIAAYPDAADDYERFATLFPRDPQAGDALHNAYLFRVGLGQRNAAIAVLDTYEKIYRSRDPERAAALFWSRRDLLETSKQRREHALDYLRVYGKSGGLDRVVVAEASIAQIDWQQSCREATLLDVCVAVERKRTAPARATQPAPVLDTTGSSYRAPQRCGDASVPTYTLLRRNTKLAKQARDRFERVLALVRTGDIDIPADDPARARAFADASGMTLVYMGVVTLESLIAEELPEQLDFTLEAWRKHSSVPAWERRYAEQANTRHDSFERLYAFSTKQSLRSSEQLDIASMLVDGRSPRSWLLAEAHAAMGLQAFVGQLRRAPIPRGLTREIEVETYCDELATAATAIEKKLHDELVDCVERSTEYQHFDAASRWCEAELSLIDVARYPRTDELFGESRYAPTGLRSFGVQANPDITPGSATSRPSYSAAEGSR